MENKKFVNGVLVDMSPNDIVQKKVDETIWLEKNPPKTKFDIAMADLRAKRNKLLADTDWIITKSLETGSEIPASWKTYRTNLRDITEGLTTADQVKAVVFPVKPE